MSSEITNNLTKSIMKNSQKGFVNLIVLGLVVVLVAVGGYFAIGKKSEPLVEESVETSSAVDETAGWKTYKNEAYGFELKYPVDWRVGFDDYLYDGFTLMPISEFTELSKPDYTGDVYALFNIDPYSSINPLSGKEIIKTGIFAGKIVNTYSCPTDSDDICPEKYAYHKIIWFTELQKDWGIENQIELYVLKGHENIYPIMEKILSTFKFISKSDTNVSTLIKIYSHGGLCRTGSECQATTTVGSDGRVVKDGKLLKTLSKTEVANLVTKINSTDFKAIKATKFTGTCPTAYDGQEKVYTFNTSIGTHVLESCKVVIDNDSEPFVSIHKLISN